MVDTARRTTLAVAASASIAALSGCAGVLGESRTDAELQDRTGQDEIVVAVGAGNGFAFDPAAIRVDAGTTVVWEWTGRGGGHNVVAVDGAFESALTAEAGHTFTHGFEASGTYEYVCTPHQTQGMRGVVHVV